jgi:hypothetical protein
MYSQKELIYHLDLHISCHQMSQKVPTTDKVTEGWGGGCI